MSLGTVRHHLRGLRDLDNQCLFVSALGISSVTSPTPSYPVLSSPAQYPSQWDKGQVPKGADGLPRPGQPEIQQLSRWLKDFSSHTTLSRVRRGASPPGFLVSQSWSPLGPVRMCPPQLLGGLQLGLQGGLEGGSLCPACRADSRQLTGGGARLGSGGSM